MIAASFTADAGSCSNASDSALLSEVEIPEPDETLDTSASQTNADGLSISIIALTICPVSIMKASTDLFVSPQLMFLIYYRTFKKL